MNVKLTFSVFVIFILTISCYKPNPFVKEVNYIPYYLKVYEADSLYVTGDYKNAFKILNSLFDKFEPLNQPGIYEMNTYVKLAYLTKNHEKIKPVLIRLFDTWGYKPENLEHDSIMNLAFQSTNLTIKEILSLNEKYKQNVNLELKNSLIEMQRLDQLYRGKDQDKEIKREDSIDLIHKKLIFRWLENEELPDVRIIDSYVPYGIFFNHISDNVSVSEDEFIKNKLLKAIKKGKAQPDNLYMYLERQSYDRKEKQSPFGGFNFLEIPLDTITVNKNRKEIGLPSLQYEKFKQEYFERMYNVE